MTQLVNQSCKKVKLKVKPLQASLPAGRVEVAGYESSSSMSHQR